MTDINYMSELPAAPVSFSSKLNQVKNDKRPDDSLVLPELPDYMVGPPRWRILVAPRASDPTASIYKIQKRYFFFWLTVSQKWNLEDAKLELRYLRKPPKQKVKRRIVFTCD